MWETLIMVSLLLTAVILILLVLVQRGKGGGLAGALGGMGGQSAFGTKAGDTFTRITIGLATFWILLCMIAVTTLGKAQSKINLPSSGFNATAPTGEEAGGTAPAGSNTAPAGNAEGTAPAEKSE
ncbi:MAG: preprotein translocase subunit SecG [Planctomycetaceae bacterium]|nr:preprotein translocase subunit SecG [Planctomycetaceae bacterium]